MTNLEIVNRALAFIGHPPAASMSDTARGPAAAIAAYSACRDEILRMVPWTCALKRATMLDCAKQATPWTASHRYGVGERVTNDTNKIYQVTTAGLSATAGGPTGTTAAITDGSVVWKYIEASTALTNWCWWPSTLTLVGDVRAWDTGKIYVCITAGTTSVATPPTGTSQDITDNTVHWRYYGTIGPNLTKYIFQFVAPPDSLRVYKIPDVADLHETDQGVQYGMEGKFIYTDQEASDAKYICNADPSEFDPLLVGTIALRIAAEIAYSVTAQVNVMKTCYDALGGQYASARMASMGEAQEGLPEAVRWEEV